MEPCQRVYGVLSCPPVSGCAALIIDLLNLSLGPGGGNYTEDSDHDNVDLLCCIRVAPSLMVNMQQICQ